LAKDSYIRPKLWKRIRPYEALYNAFVGLNKGGREISISYEDFLEFTKIDTCYYCGNTVHWSEHNVGQNGPSYNLDRKDNDLWYTKENCTVCCKSCNRTKSNRFTADEFLVMMQALKAYRSQKAKRAVA